MASPRQPCLIHRLGAICCPSANSVDTPSVILPSRITYPTPASFFFFCCVLPSALFTSGVFESKTIVSPAVMLSADGGMLAF